jgi:ATP-dependent RNA helicase RhlE
VNSFSDFGLRPALLKTLKEQKIAKPTEIQTQIIPLLMSGQSVTGVSETGSGKTLAYVLPMLQLLKGLEDEGNAVQAEAAPRAVVMVPTRELGDQVLKVFKLFTHDTRLRVRPGFGGMTLEKTRKNISGPFEILLATPGRMVQMLDRDLIDLSDVHMLVFDEADQMMDQGFLADSKMVAAACPSDVRMALFSATISATVQELMNSLFSSAEFVRSKNSGKVVPSLVTQNRTVEDGKRWPLLAQLLTQNVEGGTILFANTREQCDALAELLRENGFECAIYRGEMDKSERRSNLKKFRDGQVDLLVATDLAGRGLDIPSVGRVINYHLPKQMDNYLHRVGRTARAGRKGLVINLITERDHRLMEKLGGYKIPSSPAKSKVMAASSQAKPKNKPKPAASKSLQRLKRKSSKR